MLSPPFSSSLFPVFDKCMSCMSFHISMQLQNYTLHLYSLSFLILSLSNTVTKFGLCITTIPCHFWSNAGRWHSNLFRRVCLCYDAFARLDLWNSHRPLALQSRSISGCLLGQVVGTPLLSKQNMILLQIPCHLRKLSVLFCCCVKVVPMCHLPTLFLCRSKYHHVTAGATNPTATLPHHTLQKQHETQDL